MRVALLVTFYLFAVGGFTTVKAESLFESRMQDLLNFIDKFAGQSPAVKGTRNSEKVAIKAIKNRKKQRPFHAIVVRAARRYGIDPYLLHAMIKYESGFNAFAVSQKGAVGLCQLMPETAKELGVTDPFDPRQNIYGGARYYRWLLEKFGGNHYMALLAYNAGPGKVERKEVPASSHQYAREVLSYWRRLKQNG